LCLLRLRSEVEASSELHLERDRNRRRGRDPAKIADRLVIRGGRKREPAVAVAEVRAVENIVELGKQLDLPSAASAMCFVTRA
jgi:hypothetical protein